MTTSGAPPALIEALAEEQTLPVWAYTSEDVAGLERSALFAATWVCIGLETDAPGAGDIHPVTGAGQGLLLMRDRHGSLGVFHNFCRHRGLRLVDEPRTDCRRIVCPYHAWVYGTDGRLGSAPHFDGPDAAASIPVPGLLPVRFATWAGLVFVNLSGDAVDFDRFIAPLARRWQRYDFSGLVNAGSRRVEVNANWKLAVENFVDFYHLPAVHQGLNRYSSMGDHYFVAEGEDLFGQGNAHYSPSDDVVGVFEAFPGLDPEATRVTEALCLFPNLLITVFSDNLRIILVEPDGPSRCSERVELFLNGHCAVAPELAAQRRALISRFESFNDEDVVLVQALQRSMSESAFGGGCFSPYFDRNVARFQRRVVGFLTA